MVPSFSLYTTGGRTHAAGVCCVSSPGAPGTPAPAGCSAAAPPSLQWRSAAAAGASGSARAELCVFYQSGGGGCVLAADTVCTATVQYLTLALVSTQ